MKLLGLIVKEEIVVAKISGGSVVSESGVRLSFKRSSSSSSSSSSSFPLLEASLRDADRVGDARDDVRALFAGESGRVLSGGTVRGLSSSRRELDVNLGAGVWFSSSPSSRGILDGMSDSRNSSLAESSSNPTSVKESPDSVVTSGPVKKESSYRAVVVVGVVTTCRLFFLSSCRDG